MFWTNVHDLNDESPFGQISKASAQLRQRLDKCPKLPHNCGDVWTNVQSFRTTAAAFGQISKASAQLRQRLDKCPKLSHNCGSVWTNGNDLTHTSTFGQMEMTDMYNR